MSRRAAAGRVKHALKVAAAYGLYYTGLLLIWKTVVMRRRAVVLMYHRVLTADEARRTGSHPALIVSSESFGKQMRALRRHFTVLSAAELADRLEQRRPFPNATCVITFDDGWRDNYENALPMMERYGLPALVFLPANYIGGRRLFWQEALTHLLLSAIDVVAQDPASRPALAALLAPCGLDHVLDFTVDDGTRSRVIAAVSSRKPNAAAMRALAPELAAALGVDTGRFADLDGFMDWDQAADMARRGVTVGGHGVDHLLLTQVTPAEVDAELRCSKRMLESRFPDAVPAFSYPNGYHTPEIVERTKAAGFRLAFITRRGFVTCDSDPFTLSRLNMHEDVTDSVPMFMARVVGLY